ncbi:MAG TPA: ABC transporter permease [Aggregatilineales bacterium]|nr:ABC transporter permease [Anaerolineales bacterium]HRE47007.1 ABC transporter permease [Aggregatilineales bacterium]
MVKFIVRRVIEAIPLLFIVSIILFVLINAVGDPLAVFGEARNKPNAQQREEIRRRLGLDQPIYMQYLTWLIGNDWQMVDVRGDGTLMEAGTRKGVLRGEFGNSIITRTPAIRRIQERLPNTLLLMVPAFIITVILAILIGIFSAIYQYSLFDNLVTGLSFFFYSMPIFFIALMCIYIFGVQFDRWGLDGLPIGGMGEPGAPKTFANVFPYMIMPTFCLVAIQLAGYVRFVRSSMLEVMTQDYIRTARSKGMFESRVVRLHAVKNAALPLVTLIGLDIPLLLAGAVVTERIFAWPGMGRLFTESLERSDFNVMMLILMLLSVAVIVFQIITDIVYTWFDPRIRFN